MAVFVRRQPEGDRSPLALDTLSGDASPLRRHQRADDGQAQSRSTAVAVPGGIYTVETLKNERQVLCRDARTLVADRAQNFVSFSLDGSQ